MSSPPTLKELHQVVKLHCDAKSLSELIGRCTSKKKEDVIIVEKKSKPQQKQDDETHLKARYAQQFHRNRFDQFKDCHDTHAFFGTSGDK